jgi:RimJ/RimL family protein N-acetyltransferase
MGHNGASEEALPMARQHRVASILEAEGVKRRDASLRARIKDLLKRALSRIVDYRINWIFAQNTAVEAPALPPSIEITVFDDQHLAAFAHHPDARVRSAMSFERAGCIGFVLLADAEPAACIHFADRSRYESVSTWPLANNEVALVNVTTLPEHRSRRYASLLIAQATSSLVPSRYRRALAHIWWNHHASLRAFRNAGWQRVGISIEISRHKGSWYSVHLPWKVRS